MEIKDNEMVEEFLNDDASLMIDHIQDEAKADLLLYFMYKTAQHMRILVGILTIWTVFAFVFIIYYLIWG